MLGTLRPEQKNWKHVKGLKLAYNITHHESTGYSPCFLMFGRHPRLPIDVLFHQDPESSNNGNYNNFVERLKEQLEQAYDRAS